MDPKRKPKACCLRDTRAIWCFGVNTGSKLMPNSYHIFAWWNSLLFYHCHDLPGFDSVYLTKSNIKRTISEYTVPSRIDLIVLIYHEATTSNTLPFGRLFWIKEPRWNCEPISCHQLAPPEEVLWVPHVTFNLISLPIPLSCKHRLMVVTCHERGACPRGRRGSIDQGRPGDEWAELRKVVTGSEGLDHAQPPGWAHRRCSFDVDHSVFISILLWQETKSFMKLPEAADSLVELNKVSGLAGLTNLSIAFLPTRHRPRSHLNSFMGVWRFGL